MRDDMKTTNSQSALEQIHQFHREVDSFASELRGKLGNRIRCRLGCSECCVDDLSVFTIEALRIKSEFAKLLETESPASEEACAFLDEDGACRIYSARPYVCRTQGLPIRWFDEMENGQMAEYRDICPVNDEGPPIEGFEEELFLTIGPFENRLRAMQSSFDDNKMERVHLRDLFRANCILF
jgi:uncharacterized protein